MTPERLEELRRLAADPRWGCSNHVGELLEEVDRLRTAAEGLLLDVSTRERVVRLLRYSDGEAKSVAYSNVIDRGRELGLFTDKP